AREEDMAQFVACANMGAMSDSWLEELFTHAYNSGINRGGFDDETLINTLTREGPTLVSGLGYAYGYTVSKSDMAEILSRVSSPRWQARCALYDPVVNPKFRAEFDTWIDLLAAGQFGPSYGDSGAARAVRYPKGIPASLSVPYARAYRRWPTEKLARAIHRAGRRPPLLFEPDVWSRVEEHVGRIGAAPPLESRVLDGMGFALLESRPQAPQLKERAAVALRYGYAVGHHHHDNLNIEMWAHGESVSPELGYPCWAHPLGNTGFVAHHNTGMINRTGQYAGGIAKGALEQFAQAPGVSFVDVSAEPSGFPNRVYRRAVCLIDAPGGNVYLFDVFRMAGGDTRTFCFHGPGHKAWDSNLEFGPEKKGAWQISGVGRNLKSNILDPRVARSDHGAWADWACDRSDMHVRLDMLAEPGRSYITAKCGKTDLPPIRYLFAEDEGADRASQFVAFWQPYLDTPFIEKVERLAVMGASEGEFQPVAVRVTLPAGRMDTLIYSGDEEARLRVGDIEFQGSFGYWSEQNGKLRCMQLVNGSMLAKGDLGVRNVEPCFRTTVTSVDHAAREVTLERALPTSNPLAGSLIHFRNGSHRTAYHIKEALPPGNKLKLDLDAIIFRSKIVEFAEDGSHVVCELTPRIPACGGATPHGYYDGAFATSENLSALYRVTKTVGNRIYLTPNVQPEHFSDSDGDGRTMLRIYDIGAGDEVALPNSVFLRFPQ
ncbi:MAG: heparinase II/III family protein, partial [Lentisphaeria bacterium]|nr:heparinase II/III family protein [Lentisphaeria bacterium]